MDLTKEDIKYICTVIPYQETAAYFRKNPKEFTKIRPGFRVKSLNEDMFTRILYDFRAKDFILDYLNKQIDRRIKEIDDDLINAKEKGLDQDAAYVDVLSRSIFSRNVALFFKIKEEKKSEEYLSVLSSVVFYEAERHKKDEEEFVSAKKNARELKEKQKELERQLFDEKKKIDYLKNHEVDICAQLEQKSFSLEEARREQKKSEEKCRQLKERVEKLKADLIKTKDDEVRKSLGIQQEIDELTQKLKEQSKQVEEYSTTITALEDKLNSADEDIQTWRNQVRIREKQIFTYKAEMATLLAENNNDKKQIKELKEALEQALSVENAYKEQLENLCSVKISQTTEHDINEALGEQKTLESAVKEVSREHFDSERHTLMQPESMEDFDEYFSYNLENIGFNQNEEASMDFLCYLQNIFFNGVPLLIKRGPGINIANSLSNTLHGVPAAARLLYSDGPDAQKVEEFLARTSDRVVCIDGFIGNCNVLELIPVLEQHRNKIIILTYMFDRTLTFVPNEILSYVHFISADMFSPLLRIKDITEDPSKIKEIPMRNKSSGNPDTRLQKIFKDIACECGVEMSTASAMSDMIGDENHLNNVLMFTLLPYVQKILGKNPYNCSKRLQRYAGESGRCIKKEIMLRWFG